MMFNVVDIDPYGSPAKFLESAVLGLKRPGVLMLTATDAAVLCGTGAAQRSCCLSRYSAMPVPSNSSCHEFGIRILLYALAQHCAGKNASISPLLSLSIDFYFRIFVELKRTKADTKNQLLEMCGYCLYCPKCRSTETVRMKDNVLASGPNCKFCFTNLQMAGPLWIGPIHCKRTVSKMLSECILDSCRLNTKARIIGLLSTVNEELDDSPLYFIPSHLCKCLNVVTASAKELRSALVNAGYAVSSTHCNKEGIKTNAPYSVVWSLLNHWALRHPSKKAREDLADFERHLRDYKAPDSPKIDFTFRIDAQSKSRIAGLKRFPPNPQAMWGPAKRPRQKSVSREPSPDQDC